VASKVAPTVIITESQKASATTTYNAHLPLFHRLQCFAHRFTYACSKGPHQEYIETRKDQFLEVERLVRESLPTQDILVIGDSRAGQVGEALICAFRSRIVHMAATDLYSGCLVTHNISHKCDGHGTENHCGMYLATATLNTGVRIHMANNHPWLFGGQQRLTMALDHMQIRPAELGIIVVGSWNDQQWAKTQFADRDREGKGLYPISQLIRDFRDEKGDLHEFSRCGGGFNVSNKVLLNSLTEGWNTDDLLDYFGERGFTGKMLLGTHFNAVIYNPNRRPPGSDMFEIHNATQRPTCNVPNCTRIIMPGGHSCMPGDPFLFVKDVLQIS